MGIVKNLFRNTQTQTRHTAELVAVLETLQKIIKHNAWFIAGSYANTKIASPNDIDVYFFTEEDYNAALTHLQHKHPIDIYGKYSSPNAESFYIGDIPIPVQFVKKHYGTVEEVFDRFDLNVSKCAIRPTGVRIEHPSARDNLTITRVNAGTFDRCFKYLRHLNATHRIPEVGKNLIDTYIHDSTVVTEYYDSSERVTTINRALLSSVRKFSSLKPYAYEQAAIHAPELLI